jgi:class 3 adenylate cyclase/predicted ATPase
MLMNVADWLRGLGLEQYATGFRDNDIDGDILPELTADDLIGLGVASIGHRRKLLAAIAALRETSAAEAAANPVPAEPADNAGAERRLLTVMFCDLVDSTALSARLDPEDLRELIGDYHRAVSETVGRFSGFVAKYMGDGVLIYFGYPQAHEDDAERAVRAGLAVIEAIGKLPAREDLRVRLGIATGLAVVGDLIGEGAAQERGVVGETPNLAARLQALATPNAVIVADSTRRQLGTLFEIVDLGAQALKGFAGEQRAWRVVGESGVASRFEALRSGETPLVGREEEIELLIRRWQQAKSGDGRVVLISGEPGIGKSRLTAALSEHIEAEPHVRLRYFCSPHYQDSAFYPIIGQLEHAAGFARGDDVAAKRRKLGEMLGAESLAEDLGLLADLLSIRGAQPDGLASLTPQQMKERTFDSLLRNLVGLTTQQPVLMVFEDLHWMDPTSLELLDRTIARVERLPVLLIATFRPEFEPSWVGQPHVTLLSLSRLGRRAGAELVQQLAGNLARFPDDVLDEIIERTDGVPLFLEEVTKAILEAPSGAASAAVATIPGARTTVPATLQASLMARLDRHGLAAREIAQTGAAIGRGFSYDLVTAASPRGEAETRAALDQLVAAGLVFQRGAPPASDYQFKHALVQDTAYGTLLRGTRQTLHGRIAAAIEARIPERIEREPELLAYHLAESGQPERAAFYWRKAGEQTVRRAANREAVGHFRRALALVAARPETAERSRAELAILSQLGPVLMAVYGWSAPEVGDVVERAAEIGRQLESSPDLAPAIANLWMFNIARGRLDRADEISADLFRMARALGDSEILLEAHHCAWATRFFQGRFKEAGEHIDAGTSLYDGERHAHLRHIYLGHDPSICGMNFGASVQNALGYFDRGQILAVDGITQARRLEHPPSLANALWRACEAFVTSGDVTSVLANATELLELTDVHGFPLPRGWALSFLGWALARSGEPAEGMVRFDQGQKILTDMGAQVQATLLLGLRAESLTAAGRYAEGLEQADQALKEATTRGELSYLSRLHRARAELLLHAGSAGEEAVWASLREALVVARQQGAKGFEIGAAADLARHWSARGRRAEALALLAPVHGWFTEGFGIDDLKAAKSLLDELG